MPLTNVTDRRVAYKSPANIAQDAVTGAGVGAGQIGLFNVVGGFVEVELLFGVVTTVIQTQANDMKLFVNPSVGADVDLCTAIETTADAVGTVHYITGDISDAMIAVTSGPVELEAVVGFICPIGIIGQDAAAANTGQMEWYCVWRPITPGAYVEAL